jgi:hypothetical protein
MMPELKEAAERFLVARALPVLLCVMGCASVQGPPERPRIADINVTGGMGVTWVSFDDASVWGSGMQVSRRQDGTWAGEVGSSPIDARFDNDELVINRTLHVGVTPVPEGYLATYRGVDKELIVACAPKDEDCANRASSATALEACKPYGCSKVTYAFVFGRPPQTPTAQIALALLPNNWR